MISAAVALAISLLTVTALTPLVRAWALSLGAVDQPGGRRVHQRVTPRLGGIAIVAGFVAPLVVLGIVRSQVASLFFQEPTRVIGLGVGGLVVAAAGAWDDLRGMSPARKLAFQVLAAVIAHACGFRIDAIVIPGVGPLSMGIFGLPVTVVWFLAIINALNLIDGLDGLAAGIALFACVANFVVASINGAPLVVLMSACLGGGLLGFLRYNFNPAKIFMGDSGSMFLGFTLAATSLMGATVKSSTAVAILVPVVSLGVPIVDTLLAMVRRALLRRSIFGADRGHIHHRLLDLGLTHRRAVLVLYGLSVLLTMAAVLLVVGKDWEVGLALTVVALVIGVMVRAVRAFEMARFARGSVAERTEALTELRRAVARALLGIATGKGEEHVVQHLRRLNDETKLQQVSLQEASENVAAQRPADIGDAVMFDFGIADKRYTLRADVGDLLQPAGPDVNVLIAMLADACEEALRGVHVVAGRAATAEPAGAPVPRSSQGTGAR